MQGDQHSPYVFSSMGRKCLGNIPGERTRFLREFYGRIQGKGFKCEWNATEDN